MADLFISYSRRDQQFVRDLVERLDARGKGCWVDWQDIPLTAEWIQEIYEGIEGSDAFVFVISPESARSTTCRDEIAHAERLNKRIVPILRRDVDGAELPNAIGSRNWIPLPESVDLDKGVDRLVDAMDQDLEHVRRHTRWLEKALEWDKSERETSLLLRGTELRSAEEWLAGAAEREPAPTPLHYDYARASRGGATRRLRLVIVAFAGALVVTFGLALAALIQRDREISARKTAESRLIAGEAVAQLQDRLDVAATLAVEAYRIKPTAAARDSVLATMRRSAPLIALLNPACPTVNVVRLSLDGSLLAAGCDNGTVTLWDATNRRRLARVRAGQAVRSLAISPDNARLAAVDEKERLKVWRLRENRTLQPVTIPFGVGAGAVAFRPHGALVVGTGDGVVLLRSDGRTRRVARFRYPVNKLAVASDGTIAAGGPGGVIVLPRRGRGWGRIQVGGQEVVQDLSFAPATRKLAIVEGERVLTWAPDEAVRRLPVTGATAAALDQHAYLAIGGSDGNVVVRDATGRPRPGRYRFHRGDDVTSIAFDGARDLVASASAGQIALWRIDGSTVQRSIPLPLEVLDDLVMTGPRTFYAGGHGRAMLQEVEPDIEKQLTGAPEGHISLAATRNGRVLVAGGAEDMVVWTPTGPRERFSKQGDTVVAIAVSRDGSVVAQGTQHGTLNLWQGPSPRTKPETLQVSPGLLNGVTSASSGQRFAVGGEDGSVWLVDAVNASKELVGRLGSASVVAVATGEGDLIAAAGSDGKVSIWRKGSALRPILVAPDRRLTTIAFDPRGTTIAVGDDAGEVALWNVASGAPLGPPLRIDERGIESVGFDPTGQRLGIGLHAPTAVLLGRAAWDVEAAIDSLCRRLARC